MKNSRVMHKYAEFSSSYFLPLYFNEQYETLVKFLVAMSSAIR